MKMMIVVSHPVHLTVLVEKERDTVEGTMNVIWLVLHCFSKLDWFQGRFLLYVLELLHFSIKTSYWNMPYKYIIKIFLSITDVTRNVWIKQFFPGTLNINQLLSIAWNLKIIFILFISLKINLHLKKNLFSFNIYQIYYHCNNHIYKSN